MKVGDKVYCIKTHIWHDKVIHYKNKEYKIVHINNLYYISVEENTINSNMFGYDLQPSFYDLFNDYFITKQQYRKQKIQKLNEIS